MSFQELPNSTEILLDLRSFKNNGPQTLDPFFQDSMIAIVFGTLEVHAAALLHQMPLKLATLPSAAISRILSDGAIVSPVPLQP